MSKIDVTSVPEHKGSGYPAPHHLIAAERVRQRLGDAAGLNDFGVNLLHLPPGAASSQRHWHSNEDEFVYIVSGEVVLVTDAGEEILRTGDCAGFPKNVTNGHQLLNKSKSMAVCLEVGTRKRGEDVVVYSDIDLLLDPRYGGAFTHKDGSAYPKR